MGDKAVEAIKEQIDIEARGVEDGTPYAKVANILNAGTSTIAPRRFITRAVRKLKGLDDRAAKRFEEKVKS